jgi:hypothetical protein
MRGVTDRVGTSCLSDVGFAVEQEAGCEVLGPLDSGGRIAEHEMLDGSIQHVGEWRSYHCLRRRDRPR